MNEPFRKLNKIQKILLKYSDRAKYKQYKVDIAEYKINSKRAFMLQKFIDDKSFITPDKIIEIANKNGQLNVIHAGNAGDIIYALPTIKGISKIINQPINLYLLLDQPHGLAANLTHPLGNVTLNQKMADMLIPLLAKQDYINTCECFKQQDIHIKLDMFRDMPIRLDRGNIIRWYNYTMGIIPEVNTPWLTVTPDTTMNGKILIARSTRYRNPHINYSFLNQYDNLYFFGVKSEYEEMKKALPNIKHLEVDHFLQAAEMIAGAAFFIGNQSFPFSMAEALKVPRILETSYDTPNVIPDGENGYDFYLQEHFEWLVKHLSSKYI